MITDNHIENIHQHFKNIDDDLPIIAFTPGDPAGIGMDLALHLKNHPFAAHILLIADAKYLQKRAEETNQQIDIVYFPDKPTSNAQLWLYQVDDNNTDIIEAGKPKISCGQYILETLSLATKLCLQQSINALVTGPVNKALINDAGIAFSGHTEFLAELSETNKTVMMLANDTLSVCLQTTHVPLKDVTQYINKEQIIEAVNIIHNDFKNRFALEKPLIRILGLNPHAGENGHIGKEEIDEIIPAVNALQQQGINIVGPVSADTAFNSPHIDNTDVYLAMYHDQGLPVVKYTGFGETVNVTLGLPFIRTSVDHGTAYDLAASQNIDTGSMVKAIEKAIAMSHSDRLKEQVKK